jgi:hypothetical protein
MNTQFLSLMSFYFHNQSAGINKLWTMPHPFRG